jgi:hypothetical protein
VLDDDSESPVNSAKSAPPKIKYTPNIETNTNRSEVNHFEPKSKSQNNMYVTQQNAGLFEASPVTPRRRASRSFPLLSNNDEYNLGTSSNEVFYDDNQGAEDRHSLTVLTEQRLIQATRSLKPLKKFASDAERITFINKVLSANNLKK